MTNEQKAIDRDEPKKTAAEIRLLYQDRLDNISAQKGRQWSITFYTLLLYGALIGLTQLTPVPRSFETFRPVFTVLAALAVAGGSIAFLVKTQFAMVRYRNTLRSIRRGYFSKLARDFSGRNREADVTFRYECSMPLTMMAVSIAGAVVVIWLVAGLLP